MAEIRWTHEAELWLKDIYEHIALDNPQAAAQVVDEIYNTAQVLKDHPEIGHKYQTPGIDDVRILQYGHYRITCAVIILARVTADVRSKNYGELASNE